ncbi:hypothetical protein [Natronobacterium gregoryi]|uniref:Small CPxCG-related zinc finger protein n=2 Tax=Natronobacterium gregoryi TaxID=44930 RepID=L0AL48_NATGS|nr:hypothetical protein [Natronobacterium gregoryi]AFZ74526.1 hypothetical protein Natgr_3406 [Natronobacterium gregoryi SP2]ELY72400.1 hypothetical protein C490_03613 [Natronobacterium gregoryi SP2]PLK21727.1 hypothetical protein CYV19_02510 [Natronobacterium gregoryi SP2]SFI97473.1 hypothetical protein SAMN05443661_110181 [Natronobacterium gregoryi]
MTGDDPRDREDRDGSTADADTSTPDVDFDLFPLCPTCGDEIVAATIHGPAEATAVPCGCTVFPPVLEFEGNGRI